MQTAERLIDKLQIAIFNVDEWGMVQLSQADAKAIGAQLRLLVEADGGEKRIERDYERIFTGIDNPVGFIRARVTRGESTSLTAPDAAELEEAIVARLQ